jgi:hypothetical protein
MTSGNTITRFASNITDSTVFLNAQGHREERVTLKEELCKRDF